MERSIGPVAGDGDRSGPADFDTFFRNDYRRLVGFLIWIGATKEEAEDSASTVMIKAFENWTRIDHPRAWVRKAAERQFLRSAVRDLDAPHRAVKGGWLLRDDDTAPPGRERGEEKSVVDMMTRLGFQQRRAIAYVYDGFTPAQIADITGEDPATVRSNLRFARKNLSRILQENGATVDGNGEEDR